MKKVLQALLVLTVLIATTSIALASNPASSCHRLDLENRYKNSKYTFVAVLDRTEWTGIAEPELSESMRRAIYYKLVGGEKVMIKVRDVLRGAVPAQLTGIHLINKACGGFDIGTRYLIFTDDLSENFELSSNNTLKTGINTMLKYCMETDNDGFNSMDEIEQCVRRHL